jgi:hypothetical protein
MTPDCGCSDLHQWAWIQPATHFGPVEHIPEGRPGPVGMTDDFPESAIAGGAEHVHLIANRGGTDSHQWAWIQPVTHFGPVEHIPEGRPGPVGMTDDFPVGFQNSATVVDLGFYAARSYSLRRPPSTGRRLTRSWERSATG